MDTGQSLCWNAVRIIPKVKDGIYYLIHIHGFDDPLFWGTEHFDAINPLDVRVRDGGGKKTPQVDEGGAWSILLSGGCGPDGGTTCADLEERFEGIIIDITVTVPKKE